MSPSNKYVEFLKINIEHIYFDNIIPVDLIVEDFLIIKKFDLQMRRKQNDWILYGPDSKIDDFKITFNIIKFKLNPQISLNKKDEKENDSVVSFIIKPLESIFYYVTSSLEESQFINKDLVNVKLGSLAKYYEYILFFKKEDMVDKSIEIVDSLKIIEFNKPNIILYDNGQKALQFQSKNKIKLTRKATCNLKIISKSEFGDKILLDNIKIPQPQSISVIVPYEAITTFYNI